MQSGPPWPKRSPLMSFGIPACCNKNGARAKIPRLFTVRTRSNRLALAQHVDAVSGPLRPRGLPHPRRSPSSNEVVRALGPESAGRTAGRRSGNQAYMPPGGRRSPSHTPGPREKHAVERSNQGNGPNCRCTPKARRTTCGAERDETAEAVEVTLESHSVRHVGQSVRHVGQSVRHLALRVRHVG